MLTVFLGAIAGIAERSFQSRKARDRSIILLLVGLLLLVSPVAAIFRIDSHILGLPVTVLYIFIVWAFLIVAGAVIAQRLQDTEDTEAPLRDRKSRVGDQG